MIIKNQVLAKMWVDRMLIVKAIKESEDYPTINELHVKLGNVMTRHVLVGHIKFLEDSNKLIFDGDKILWTAADNPKLKELLKNSVRIR